MNRLYFILLCCVVSFSAYAQKMSIISFDKTENAEARINKVFSINRDKCALIKLNTPLDDLIFDTPEGICSVQQKTGDWWIYIPPHTRRLEVRHKLFKVLKYTLPLKIDEMVTYEVELSTDRDIQTVVKAKKPTFVLIKSTPQGASIFIDGEDLGLSTPTQKLLPAGQHTIELRLDRHRSYKQKIVVLPEQTQRIQAELTPLFRPFEVSTMPSGATVYVDGVKLGTTPLTIQELDYGKHSFVLKKELHQNRSVNQTITAQSKDLHLALTPTYGTLELDIDPDLQIRIDNTYKYGKSFKLSKGKHYLQIESKRTQPYAQYITIEQGKTLNLSPKIEKLTRSLQFTAKPLEVKVYVKSFSKDFKTADVYTKPKYLGTTPFLKTLPYGAYTFLAIHQGNSQEQSLDMIDNSATQLYFDLTVNCE